MRCPPGLIFDDIYQRCEWPGAGSQSPNHRLGSLRNKNSKKQLRLTTTVKQAKNATASPSNKLVEP